jgi:hypothetical protein
VVLPPGAVAPKANEAGSYLDAMDFPGHPLGHREHTDKALHQETTDSGRDWRGSVEASGGSDYLEWDGEQGRMDQEYQEAAETARY